MKIDASIVIICVLYIIKFVFGLWLFRTGKPYNTAILTIHKLVSLFTAIYIGLTARRMHMTVGLSTTDFIMVVLTELLFVLAIASGGILSIDKPAPAVIAFMHKIAPVLSVLTVTITIYLIFSTIF